MSDTRQFCTFHLGSLFLGVEVCHVQEVLRYQEMTDVPLTSSIISGLINLRGQIVTAIDLRERFGLDDDAPEAPMNVVIRAEEEVVSFQVDAIGDVLTVPEDAYEPPPPTLAGPTKELIRGVYKLESALLLCLDIDAALNFDATNTCSE